MLNLLEYLRLAIANGQYNHSLTVREEGKKTKFYIRPAGSTEAGEHFVMAGSHRVVEDATVKEH